MVNSIDFDKFISPFNFQVHTEYYQPDPSQRIADIMKWKMKEAVKAGPAQSDSATLSLRTCFERCP